jgi:hypothetical protein
MTSGPAFQNDQGDSCSGVFPPLNFQGLWTESWPNGQLKFRGQFETGIRRIGQHISFYENGVLQEVSFWDQGWVCGTVLWFRDDGTKEYERDYGEHGGMTRSWTEKYFSNSGDLRSVRVYRDDKLIAECRDSVSRDLWQKIGGDNIVDDAVRMVYADDGESPTCPRVNPEPSHPPTPPDRK